VRLLGTGPGRRVERPPAVGQSDQPGPPVGRIGDPLDVAVPLEVGDDLAHRLGRDVGVPGQVGDPRAPLLVYVLEDRQVGRVDRTVPDRGQPALDVPLAGRVRVAQQLADPAPVA